MQAKNDQIFIQNVDLRIIWIGHTVRLLSTKNKYHPILLIIQGCPDRVIKSITIKPNILHKILFHRFSLPILFQYSVPRIFCVKLSLSGTMCKKITKPTQSNTILIKVLSLIYFCKMFRLKNEGSFCKNISYRENKCNIHMLDNHQM